MAGPGAIVGVVGLKDSSTGETLCQQEHPVLLEKMEFYEPVISVAVEPKTHSDQEKLQQVLEKFMAEDPTLRVREDEDTGQTILSGMGELHLEIITSRMQREFNTRVNVGKPQVVYRETIESAATGTAIFDKEVAGNRHYGEIALRLEPLSRGEGKRFESHLAEEELAPGLVKAAEKGVMESLESGILMGYPVVDVKAVLTGAGTRDTNGSELAFTVAASMAVREALSQGNAFLLDPIMAVEVIVPEDFMGEVIGDLNARGGKIESIEPKLGVQTIKATVPLAKMFGYSTSLRSATQGRGTFSMQFSRFDRN
jgi:elongation factor G